MSQEYIRALVDLRDRQIQKARIQFSNRVSAIERGTDDFAHTEQYKTLAKWLDRFEIIENEIEKDIIQAIKTEIMFAPLSSVKGIGPMLAAQMIAMIDIERAGHISSLWRYAGYGVNNEGTRDIPTKGEKLCYNIRLKTTIYKAASSFLKCNSPYREIYDKAREYYEVNRPDWTKLHKHNASMRKMIKIFLSHLWLVWRQLKGLPISEPYVQAYQNHTHISTPKEYGWEYD